MANEARDKSLDILKSIGIITMVFGHSNMGETFTTYIAGFHMQLFFLISGYLFTPNKYDFKSFILRKTKTLLVPYCTFCILTLVVVLSINQISGTEVYDINCALKGIIYSNRSLFPITGAIWFLQCMFFAEIVFFLIVTYIKKYGIIISACGLLLLSYICNEFNIVLPFAIDSAISSILFLLIGYCLKKLSIKDFFASLGKGTNILVLSLIFIGSLLLIFYNGSVNPRTCTYNNYFLYYINAVLATIAWYGISVKLSTAKCNEYLASIGKYSIVYLGLNQLIIFALYDFFECSFVFDSPMSRAIRNILIGIITMFLLWVISRLTSKTKLKKLVGM